MAKDTSEQHLIHAAEAMIGHLLAAADVPGIASAVIRNGQLERTICCGVRDVHSPLSVDEDTVFDAVSLSKPVFGHVVLHVAARNRNMANAQ
jgi:CubicO group peptidase (beta-lactamase class C family)